MSLISLFFLPHRLHVELDIRAHRRRCHTALGQLDRNLSENQTFTLYCEHWKVHWLRYLIHGITALHFAFHLSPSQASSDCKHHIAVWARIFQAYLFTTIPLSPNHRPAWVTLSLSLSGPIRVVFWSGLIDRKPRRRALRGHQSHPNILVSSSKPLSSEWTRS